MSAMRSRMGLAGRAAREPLLSPICCTSSSDSRGLAASGVWTLLFWVCSAQQESGGGRD